MTSLIEMFYANQWFSFLLDASFKSFVVLFIAGGLTLTLRQASASLRHLIWLLAIVSCISIPSLKVGLPDWELTLLPPVDNSPDEVLEVKGLDPLQQPLLQPISTSPESVNLSARPTMTPSHVETVTPKPSRTIAEWIGRVHWSDWIVVAWGVGVLLFLIPLLIGAAGIWGATHRCRRVTDDVLTKQVDRLSHRLGLKRRVTILEGNSESRFTMPMTWDVLSPVVYLPTDANNWSDERLQAVLLHELAHVRRWDWLTQMLTALVCAFYWFNPLIWFAAHRIRIERERACDDQVLNAGCQSTDYADHLLSIAQSLKASAAVSRVVVAMARPSRIEGRLQAILADNLNRRPVTKVAVGVGLLVVACVALPIGAIQVVAALDEVTSYQEITDIRNQQPHENSPTTEEEIRALQKEYTQRWRRGIKLCEEFLNTYPDSKKYDEVWYYKIEMLRWLNVLNAGEEFDTEIAAFLEKSPTSRFAEEARLLKVQHLENDRRFEEALIQLDQIKHPSVMRRVYRHKGQIYTRMREWDKAAEQELLGADLILGKKVPDLSYENLQGETISFNKLRGRVVVIHIWASWRSSSLNEVPKLLALYEKYKKRDDFVMIGMSVDSDDAKAMNFIKTHGLSWSHILAG